MLENCKFCELEESVLRENNGFTCADNNITVFFTKEYADYAYQLLGKSYCFIEQEKKANCLRIHCCQLKYSSRFAT